MIEFLTLLWEETFGDDAKAQRLRDKRFYDDKLYEGRRRWAGIATCDRCGTRKIFGFGSFMRHVYPWREVYCGGLFRTEGERAGLDREEYARRFANRAAKRMLARRRKAQSAE